MQEKEEENKKNCMGFFKSPSDNRHEKNLFQLQMALKKNLVEFEKSSSIINSLKLGERWMEYTVEEQRQ